MPIAEYSINGISYQAKSNVVGILSSKDKLEFPLSQNGDIEHVNGQFIAEHVFPLNSQMTVYYNPKKPNDSFLKSSPKADLLGVCPLIIVGVLVLIRGIIVYVVT